MEGWIKIHRKMLDNPVVWKDPDYLAVWMYLLLNATHADYSAVFGGKKITLHAGQLITGRYKISEFTKVQSDKVHRILKFLKSEQQIAQQTSSKNSLITILNWDVYQEVAQQNAQQMHNRCTTDAHKQEYKNIKNKRNNMSVYKFKGRDYDFEKLEKEYFEN